MTSILQEHHMNVFVNGQFWTVFSCTPEYLTEAVFGRLKTEGIIEKKEDVASVVIEKDGTRAQVRLADPSETWKARRKILHPLTPIPWKTEWIFSLAERIANGMPLHEKIWAAHSCFLACRETLLFSCEDIGRHNAIDKVIGYGIRNDIPLNQCILYTSGRMPSDMAAKIIMAGIPVAAAKAMPMMDSVALAKQYHLTMICAARPDRIRVYTDFSRELSDRL